LINYLVLETIIAQPCSSAPPWHGAMVQRLPYPEVSQNVSLWYILLDLNCTKSFVIWQFSFLYRIYLEYGWQMYFWKEHMIMMTSLKCLLHKHLPH